MIIGIVCYPTFGGSGVLATELGIELSKKGYEIQNIKQANDVIDTIVFQAGTKVDQNKIITDGGRVLGITSLGEDLEDALSKAYISVETISYENAFYRNDIGHHELRRKKNGI